MQAGRELRAAQPFPVRDGLTLRNRLVGTAHAAGFVAERLALPQEAEYWPGGRPAGPRCSASAAP